MEVPNSIGKRALPAGAKTITVQGVGGGGAGGPTWTSGKGGDTIVRLYDGNTLKHTLTCKGGYGGSSSTSRQGHSNTFGQGNYYSGNVPSQYDNTGYGGGGGGGSYKSSTGINVWYHGGQAAQLTSSPQIDISGWANPMIEVQIGARGSDAEQSTAGKGGPGFVEYLWSGTVEVPADVVPLVPTAFGTFVKTAGSGTFPDLGAGYWVIDRGGDIVALGNITIAPGVTIWASNAQDISFFASQTPTFAGTGGQITLNYKFYSMGSWG